MCLCICTFARKIIIHAIRIKGLVLKEETDSKTDTYSLTRYNHVISETCKYESCTRKEIRLSMVGGRTSFWSGEHGANARSVPACKKTRAIKTDTNC